MHGVRWSSSPLALPFIAFFLLGSHNKYGMSCQGHLQPLALDSVT